MDLNKYKIEKIGKRGDVDIWLVDGNLIRNELDIDFTNFGQNFYHDFIPENEFWLDKEAAEDERRFFIDRLLTERKLIEKGFAWEDIKALASAKERTEREKRLWKISGHKQSDGAIAEKIRLRQIGRTDTGISVWLVDGNLVRSLLLVNFTEGGHDLIYDFIPENEVWIDNDMFPDEIGYVILHELYERVLMSKGAIYPDEAHDGKGDIKGAAEIEWEARHDRAKLDSYLHDLGYKEIK